jgi:hypothetical protein
VCSQSHTCNGDAPHQPRELIEQFLRGRPKAGNCSIATKPRARFGAWHHQHAADVEQLAELAQQLKAAREERGLSLSDMTELTGMDRSSLSRL